MPKKPSRIQPPARATDAAPAGGISRRGFLKTVGMGAAAVATARTVGAAEPAVETREIPAGATTPVILNVNGRERRVLVETRWSLLFVLRERLGLTATKEGCARGECGACTVLIDDEPRYACMVLAVEAAGHAVTTLEGLMNGERLGPVQEAFIAEDAFQCGYCTPGQVMAVEGLLRREPHPDLAQIRTGVSGNLCRCGAYAHIFQAAAHAATGRDGQGGGS